LQNQPVEVLQEPDQFVNDPLQLVPQEEYLGRAPNILDPNWLTDGRAGFEREILIYHSSPLPAAIDVAGRPVLKAYIELNVPDTDLQARLYEIRSDGTVIWLTETFMRARFRGSSRTPQLIEPGTVVLYEFDDFLIFARRIAHSSRLRLIVNGLNHPNYQKNYNSGGDVARETAAQARTAIVRLYHDKSRPSTLELPVVQRQSG
jgi:uncharacterized protein